MERAAGITGAVATSLVAIFGASGCATVSFSSSGRPLHLQRGVSEENTKLFTNQDNFEERVRSAGLANGMSPEQVFTALGLDVHKFKALTDKELMDAAYAGANPMPQTDEAMKKIMELVNKTAVYRLNYKHVLNTTDVGYDLSSKSNQQGFNRQMTLIFVENKLQNASKVLSGSPSIDTSNTSEIWDLIGGAVSGAASHNAPKPF